RWPAAAEVAAVSRACPRLSVGLHLDLCEWAFSGEAWLPLYQVVPLESGAAVEGEVARQLAAFRALLGRDPTHLDSHQHVHREEPVRSALLQVARELGIPLRDGTPGVRYCGDFYGQTAEGWPYPAGVSVAGLLAVLAALPAGVTELGCHPGEGADVEGMY